MPTLTIPNTFSSGQVAASASVNANFNAVATLLNSTLIDSTNIQTGGISTANLAASAVTTAKILDANVTAAKLASDSVTTIKILDSNVTAAKLASDSVTTVKILDGNVTQAKRVALGQQKSSTTINFSTSSTSATDVTNATITITTTGRPVFIGLQSIPGSESYIGQSSAAINSSSTYYFIRGATEISRVFLLHSFNASGGSYAEGRIPPGSVWYVDVVAAGTYTYKVQMSVGSGATTGGVTNCQLIAFEL